MARRRITSKPGLFGTVYYYDAEGNPIGKSRPGLVGETRVYTDQNGAYVGKSRPGFLAKDVYTDADHNEITSYGSICGDVHFQNGTPIGRTTPGFLGTKYTMLDEEDASEEGCCQEEDCDFDVKSYKPRYNQFKLVKTLQIIVLSLVIFMIALCVFAIVILN